MIITLKGCTATAFIGGLNFFKVSKGTVSGADVTISASTINKDEATSTSAREIATVALKSNYENLVVTVTMGGTTVNWYAGGKVTIPANTAVTGDIKISASATAVSGGDPIIPDVPVTPTMYTFTINPMVDNATVTLIATGYTQSGNSISVPSGTTVSWTVSAGGYFDKNGSETVTKDKTLNVDLGKIPDPEQPGTGGNTGGGSVEDETGITWYIDNAAQANKNFNYKGSNFPGAGLRVNPERLTNKPINVIKFCPSGEGIFAFCKLTPGTQPAVSDVYTIDIPAADVAASGTDATPKTYLLDNTITLGDGQILMFSCNGNHQSISKTAGFWVNSGSQPDYSVGTFKINDYTINDEAWGLPFSIGYKS